jgi:hypothetical protein
MIYKNIKGTVSDDIFQDAKRAEATAEHPALKKIFNKYLNNERLPKLSVTFSEAISHDSSLILSVQIPNKTAQSLLLIPGDHVECDVSPGAPGTSSQLIAIRKL